MTQRKCLSCGAEEMVHETRDLTYEYKGEKLVVPGLSGWFCTSCEDSELDDGCDEQYFAAITKFSRELDAREGEWLSRVARKDLKLSSQEIQAIIGGGKNALAKYRGGTRPVAAVTTLFALLEKHPALIKEVRAMPHVRAAMVSKHAANLRAVMQRKGEPGKPGMSPAATRAKSAA